MLKRLKLRIRRIRLDWQADHTDPSDFAALEGLFEEHDQLTWEEIAAGLRPDPASETAML